MSELTIENISYSQGFLEEWLKDAPEQIQGHLKILVDGLLFYREKVSELKEDLASIRLNYQQLTTTSAKYLELISQQKDIIDQHLIETQRGFHRTEEGI